MIEKDLLTIPEFAEAAGKKKQGIYQQVKNENSKIFPFVVFKGKTPYIKAEALKEVYGVEQADSQDENQDSQEFSQGNQAQSQECKTENQDSQADSQGKNQDSQDFSQAQSQENQDAQTQAEQEKSFISFLQEQLKEKDRQLAEKDKQIEKITLLLDQEQQLHARTTYLLAEYQKREAEQEEQTEEAETGAADPQDPPSPQEQDQEPQKKRSWLYRFFFGDE